MKVRRRELLGAGLAMPALSFLPRLVVAAPAFAPRPSAWRTFEVTTRIVIPNDSTPARAWVPLPHTEESDWFRPLENRWSGNGEFSLAKDPRYGAEMLAASWSAGEEPVLETVSRFATRDRATDFSKPGDAAPLSAEEVRHYTAATELIPTDGIVKETADRIVAGAGSDLEKARRIYDWVVENTFREPSVRGCGLGDVASMLHVGDLGGKCADLNALYVGLARAAGLPARDVYGIRVGPSQFGYKSLGANSETITKAQHCRAEVFISGWGWVPVDPADVRKVMLEEPPGGLPADDPKVQAVRRALFGAWETNWLPYNTAHDVKLPGSSAPPLGFLMYPQAETAAGMLDPLEPDRFRYEIRAREIQA